MSKIPIYSILWKPTFFKTKQAAFSYHQPHILKSLTVLCAGRNDINACRIDTAVAEYVGKFGNVLLDAVERAGKKMSQVMARPIAFRKLDG